jgi:hypothetical protein
MAFPWRLTHEPVGVVSRRALRAPAVVASVSRLALGARGRAPGVVALGILELIADSGVAVLANLGMSTHWTYTDLAFERTLYIYIYMYCILNTRSIL